MTDELSSCTQSPPPFEPICRVKNAGTEYRSSRYFARILGNVNYRYFFAVIEKPRTACFSSSQRVLT